MKNHERKLFPTAEIGGRFLVARDTASDIVLFSIIYHAIKKLIIYLNLVNL